MDEFASRVACEIGGRGRRRPAVAGVEGGQQSGRGRRRPAVAGVEGGQLSGL